MEWFTFVVKSNRRCAGRKLAAGVWYIGQSAATFFTITLNPNPDVMTTVSKVAILIDGGYFLRRYKALNNTNPRITDIGPFLDDLMAKVQATSPVQVSDIMHRAFYYDCRPYGETIQDPNGKVAGNTMRIIQVISHRTLNKRLLI